MFSLFRSAPVAARPRPTQSASKSTTHYRVLSGRTDYSFSLERQAGGLYRVYITSQPSYGSRATDIHSTHRHYDGRYFICWTGALRNEDDCRSVIKDWAELTEKYILHGTRF